LAVFSRSAKEGAEEGSNRRRRGWAGKNCARGDAELKERKQADGLKEQQWKFGSKGSEVVYLRERPSWRRRIAATWVGDLGNGAKVAGMVRGVVLVVLYRRRNGCPRTPCLIAVG
jgi:hypothetical protein